jgi:hypothetical protein
MSQSLAHFLLSDIKLSFSLQQAAMNNQSNMLPRPMLPRRGWGAVTASTDDKPPITAAVDAFIARNTDFTDKAELLLKYLKELSADVDPGVILSVSHVILLLWWCFM